MTTVVNLKTDKLDVNCEYCGRGSIFGNPYETGIDGTREQVIQRYRKWFNFLLRDPRFKREVLKLKDKQLSCFCKPQSCHVDIIAEYLNNL